MAEEIQKIKVYSAKEERLAKYSGEDRVISSHELEKELEVMKGKTIYSFKSGLPTLDLYTEGFESGELIVVSGYTGHGKTSLCQSLTVNFEEQGIRSLWFSYEMPPRQFLAKFQGKPLFYLPRQMKERALNWIEDRILEAKVKYETRIVIIDHLHFLIDLIRMGHPSLEIGTIVRSLKQLAMKYNIVVFLIAHTSMPKGDKPPELEDIRDSSFITQEADAVLVIKRIKLKKSEDEGASSMYGNDAWISILKHRRMGTIGKKVKVLYKDKRFYEVAKEV